MSARLFEKVLGTPDQARERGWEAERRIYQERIAHLREALDQASAERDRARTLAAEFFELLCAADVLVDQPYQHEEAPPPEDDDEAEPECSACGGTGLSPYAPYTGGCRQCGGQG